jgi:hypothetical protein
VADQLRAFLRDVTSCRSDRTLSHLEGPEPALISFGPRSVNRDIQMISTVAEESANHFSHKRIQIGKIAAIIEVSLAPSVRRVQISGSSTSMGENMRSERDDVAPLLRAIILLELETLNAEGVAVRAEALLHRAVLGITEIAALLDKTYSATVKALTRAKRGRARRLTERRDGP